MYVCMNLCNEAAGTATHSVWQQVKSAYNMVAKDDQVRLLLNAIEKGDQIISWCKYI